MKNELDKLLNDLAEQATAVKPAPPPWLLSLKLLGAAALYLAATLWLTGLRPGLADAFGDPFFIAEMAVLTIILLATTVSTSLLAFPDLHQRHMLAVAPAWVFAAFWLVIVLAWHADKPPAPLPLHSYQCTLSIALVALPPAAWTFYLLRQYASTHYYLAGSVALFSAFSTGAIWLRLHEINDSIPHVVEWHYLPLLASGLLGLWLGKLLLKW